MSEMIIGICGVVATILTAAITPIVQKVIEQKNFIPITADRRKKLEGKWKGNMKQFVDQTFAFELYVELDFEIKLKKVYGSGLVILGEKRYEINLEGSFRNDKFLKLDYQNKDYGILQFGCFVFYLSDDAKVLTGRFVGYGHINQTLVHGNGIFEKW